MDARVKKDVADGFDFRHLRGQRHECFRHKDDRAALRLEGEVVLGCGRVGQTHSRLLGITHHLGDGGLEKVLERGAVHIGEIRHRHEEPPAFLQKFAHLFLFFSGALDVFLVRIRVARRQPLQLLCLGAQVRADFVRPLFIGEKEKNRKTEQTQRNHAAADQEKIFLQPVHVRASSDASIST